MEETQCATANISATDYKVDAVVCPYYRLDDEYKIARKQ